MQSLLDSDPEAQRNPEFYPYIALLLLFLVFGLSTFFGTYVYKSFTDVANNTILMETSEQRAAVAGFDRGMATFDNVSVIIVILIILSIGVGSYYLSNAPIFFVLMLIFGVMLGSISWFLNYVSAEFIYNPVFHGTLMMFPKLAILMTNLHWIALLMIIVGILVRFGKKEVGDGGSNAYL